MSPAPILREDLEIGVGISVARCDSCSCGALGIRLHDAEGRIFAAVRLAPGVAAAFIEQVRQGLEPLPIGLGAIRCEGSA